MNLTKRWTMMKKKDEFAPWFSSTITLDREQMERMYADFYHFHQVDTHESDFNHHIIVDHSSDTFHSMSPIIDGIPVLIGEMTGAEETSMSMRFSQIPMELGRGTFNLQAQEDTVINIEADHDTEINISRRERDS